MRQEEIHYPNTHRRIVQGVYYVGKRRVYRKLATFEEAELDAAGLPLPGSDAAARDALLDARYAEQGKKLEREPAKVKLPAGASIGAALQDWIDAMEPERSPRTIEYFRTLKAEYLAAAGDHPVAAFSLRHYDKLLVALDAPRNHPRWKRRKDYKLSPVSKNIRLKALGAFFTWAADRDLIPKRPKIKLLKVHKQLPRVPSAAQMEALFARLWERAHKWSHAHQQREYRLQLRFYLLARFTGARLQELFWLPWANVDTTERVIRVLKSRRFTVKERKEKTLPIPPPLLAFLERERAAHPDEVWLFDNGKGELAYKSPYGLSAGFRRAWAADGIGVTGIKPAHAFRAFFAQNLWDRGVDLSVIQQWLGHQNIEVTAGYFSDPFRRLKDGAALIDGPSVLTEGANAPPKKRLRR